MIAASPISFPGDPSKITGRQLEDIKMNSINLTVKRLGAV